LITWNRIFWFGTKI